MGTRATNEQLAMLEIVGKKMEKAGLVGDTALDWNIWKTSKKCPKCSGDTICFHEHKIYIGPIYHKENHGDGFTCVCESPDCDWIETKFVDTPATASAEEKGFVRPKICPITGDVIPNIDRVYNNSQY